MGKKLNIFVSKLALWGAVFALTFFTFSSATASAASLSRNWAGYVSTQGKFTSVSATWTVPNVQATQNFSGDMTWVGIGGYTSSDLIQAGTLAIVEKGRVTYKAWYETLPLPAQIAELDVRPGDSVSAKISQQPNGLWLIQLTNNTIAQSFRTVVYFESSYSSAEWIEEMPARINNSYVPLDNFGVINFSSAEAEINGSVLTVGNIDARALNMVTAQEQALAAASQISQNGLGFSISRTNFLAVLSPATNQVLSKTRTVVIKAKKVPILKPVLTKNPIMPRGPSPKFLVLR